MKKGTLLIVIIAGFAVITLVMSAIGFFLIPGGGGEEINEKMIEAREETAVNIANVIAAASIDPLYLEDDFVINETIQKAMDNSGGMITYIYVLDADRKVWGDTQDPTNVLKTFKRPEIELLSSENRKIQKISDQMFDAGVPILDAGEKIGEVHIGVKYPPVQQASGSMPIVPVGIMFAIGLIGTIIIAMVVSRMMENVGAAFATSLKSAKLDELRKQEDEAQKTLTAKNQKVKEAEKKLEEVNSRIKELGSKYDEVRDTLDKSDEKIAEKEKQIEYYNNKIEELEKKAKTAKQQADVPEMSDKQKREISTLKSQVNNFKIQLQQTISEIEKKRQEEKELNERIKKEKAQLSNVSSSSSAPATSEDIEKKKREEIEITQRIVSKRKEEIALSQRIELKRKKELELTGRIEMLEKKLKEMGNG